MVEGKKWFLQVVLGTLHTHCGMLTTTASPHTQQINEIRNLSIYQHLNKMPPRVLLMTRRRAPVDGWWAAEPYLFQTHGRRKLNPRTFNWISLRNPAVPREDTNMLISIVYNCKRQMNQNTAEREACRVSIEWSPMAGCSITQKSQGFYWIL